MKRPISGVLGARKSIAALVATSAFLTGCGTIPIKAIEPFISEAVEYETLEKRLAYEEEIFEKYERYNIEYSEESDNYRVGIVVVDMQNLFLRNCDKDELLDEIPKQAKVLDWAMENQMPIFVLEYEGIGETIDFLKDGLNEYPDVNYMSKTTDSGFLSTDLDQGLKFYGLDTVFMMGVNASGCVIKTGASALKNGYNIITSTELMDDNEKWETDESVKFYEKFGIHRSNYLELIEIIEEGRIDEFAPKDIVIDKKFKDYFGNEF